MSSRVASSAISPSGQSRCWDSNNQFICIAQWSNLGCRIYLRKLSIRPISKSPFPIPPPLLKWRKSCTVFLYLCLSKSLYFPPIGKWPCDAIELTENWRDRCAEASLPMWILQCVKKDSILAHKLENCSKMTSNKINK